MKRKFRLRTSTPKVDLSEISRTFLHSKEMKFFLKKGKNLKKDLQMNLQKASPWTHIINEIFYNWYGKCTSSNIHPDKTALQEEAMEIKKRLDKENLMTSQTQMDAWRVGRKTYSLREKRLCREVDDVATTIIQACGEWLPELCHGYEPQNILNLDELGLFFKTRKRFTYEKSKTKVGKNQDKMTAMLIAATDSSFVFEPIAIWWL